MYLNVEKNGFPFLFFFTLPHFFNFLFFTMRWPWFVGFAGILFRFVTFALSLKIMAKIGINIATGSLQKDDIIVGIDLGTTNSLIAIIRPDTGKPVALKEHDSSSLVPSVIHFADGNVVVGNEAKQYLETDPEIPFSALKD